MNLKSSLYKSLNEKRVFYLLFSLNIIIGTVIFNISSGTRFPDEQGYWLLGESLLHGKFSSWYFLPKYYPETLRTPGYPLFLALCQLISKSQLFVKVLQLLIYFISVCLCILIIKRIDSSLIFRNLFLIVLTPNIQIVYFTGYISAEILTMFFLVLTMYLIFLKRSILHAVFLAFSCYSAFIIRPAFLFFPILLFIYFIFQNKKDIKFSAAFIFIYSILLIPFGLWNKFNHGVFKVTPMEGGAGVAHSGYWQLRLLDGYTENFYWGNNTMYDYFKPQFYTDAEQQKNIKIFEQEWIDLLSKINIYESKEDSLYLDYMNKNNPGIFLLHNSKYTLKREQALWGLTKQHITNDPVYYIKSRIYHFIRFYFSGVNYKNLQDSSSFSGILKVVYPFIITFAFIFTGLIFITVTAAFRKIHFFNLFAFILLFWYYGAVHLPFVTQARYSIPIHLLILSVLSVTILKTLKFYRDRSLF